MQIYKFVEVRDDWHVLMRFDDFKLIHSQIMWLILAL
jgi:hypothetical protein